MTVKQLIALLQTVSPDSVVTFKNEDGWATIGKIEQFDDEVVLWAKED